MPYQVMRTLPKELAADYSSAANSLYAANANNAAITCNWQAFCAQILQQWQRLTLDELERTGHERHNIAALIQSKYGISLNTAENYLLNFERALPLLGCA